MGALATIASSLREGFFMFYDTFWALVLGFGLSGAVQAFVSRGEMQRVLGDHRARTIVRSSVLGMVSSSCSYAASALAKSLFVRGADFTAAMVFMFASTNLVVELGAVLWLLIGWQFAVAEFVGGFIMIAILALVLPRVVDSAELDAVRDRLGAGTPDAAPSAGQASEPAPPAQPWRRRIRSRAGWEDASGYTISDLTMLRKELLVGFLVAGFASVAVPTRAWRALFLTGHGLGSTIENVVVGPVLAFVSFVCSVGNVPLAAALWKGGISFGGVIAFVFADLLALPLVLIYRRYYGTRLALRLALVFWAVMSAAGLMTELVFRAIGSIPMALRGDIATGHVGLNATTVLDAVALLALGYLYSLYRRAAGLRGDGTDGADGGDAGPIAKDVVCGMQVRTADAPARSRHEGRTYFFCSDRCEARFAADPSRYVSRTTATPAPSGPGASGTDAGARDPVCGMAVDPGSAVRDSYAGREYLFCSEGCRSAFRLDPLAQLREVRDPVCGMSVAVDAPGAQGERDGVRYLFCGPGCAAAFAAAGTGVASSAAVGRDPVCGMSVDLGTAAVRGHHAGAEVAFCSPGCRERFAADPGAFTSGTGR